MWDGHGESFAVPRATPKKGAEVALPIGSYTSAPDVGTDTPGHPPVIGTDPHGRPAPRLAPEECAELQPRNWQPGLAWQAPDVRDTASAAQAAAASSGQPPSSPSSTSSDSSPPSPGTSVSFALPLPGQLWVPSLVHRQVRRGGLVMLPLIWFRLMSWLVALFLMLWQLHLLMQTCLQMMPQTPPMRRLQQ